MKALGHVCRCSDLTKEDWRKLRYVKNIFCQKHALNGDLEQGARIYMEWDSA